MSEESLTVREKAIAQLRSAGIRPLQMRVAIYEYLLDNLTHPSVDEIYTGLRLSYPGLSKTTVYNVLNLLHDKNLVQKVSIEEREMRYDSEMFEHVHFRCSVCGTIRHLDEIEFPRFIAPSGYNFNSIQVNIEGICPACAN